MKFFKIFKIRTYLKRFYKRCKLCRGMRHPPLSPAEGRGGAVGTIRFFADAQNDRKTFRMTDKDKQMLKRVMLTLAEASDCGLQRRLRLFGGCGWDYQILR